MKIKLTNLEANQLTDATETRHLMPAQVATEMLLSADRLTNPARKAYMEARQRYFESTRSRVPSVVKILNRANKANAKQLKNWSRRSGQRMIIEAARCAHFSKEASTASDGLRGRLEIQARHHQELAQVMGMFNTFLTARVQQISERAPNKLQIQ